MSSTKEQPRWVLVNPSAGWNPRDSMGDFVFDDHLWVLGGWYSAKTPNPVDVWKSPDGKQWTCVQEHAPWEHSDLPVSLAFKNRMWMMGGRKLPGTNCSNKVWSSTNGERWSFEGEGGWSARLSSAFAVFKDRMWVLGGTENFYDHSGKMVKNDVWSSPDGKRWTQETPAAPWSPRAHGQAVVFKDKLWLVGGGLGYPQHVETNDVWCSEDGVNWEQVTSAAAWEPRIWFGCVAYANRLWLFAGWSKRHGNFGDVWHSSDGRNWTELKSTAIWKKRHEVAAYVFKDKIWLAGGHAEPLSNEVWTLEIPPGWCNAS